METASTTRPVSPYEARYNEAIEKAAKKANIDADTLRQLCVDARAGEDMAMRFPLVAAALKEMADLRCAMAQEIRASRQGDKLKL